MNNVFLFNFLHKSSFFRIHTSNHPKPTYTFEDRSCYRDTDDEGYWRHKAQADYTFYDVAGPNPTEPNDRPSGQMPCDGEVGSILLWGE